MGAVVETSALNRIFVVATFHFYHSMVKMFCQKNIFEVKPLGSYWSSFAQTLAIELSAYVLLLQCGHFVPCILKKVNLHAARQLLRMKTIRTATTKRVIISIFIVITSFQL